MSSNTTVLITGSNRGIGKTLLTTYLARPSTTVISLVRDPKHASSQTLPTLPTAKGSKLIILPYDASDPESAKSAVAALQTTHAVTHLDVVIANSGVLSFHGPSATVTQADLVSHLTINTIAPVLLFSAVLPLLEKSSSPKFFTISSGLGSNGQLEAFQGMPLMPYGVSKAGVNFAMRKLHFEYPRIVVSPLTPGWVQTDMGADAAKIAGMDSAPLTSEQSVNGMLKHIDSATRETSGRFWSWEGEEIPW